MLITTATLETLRIQAEASWQGAIRATSTWYQEVTSIVPSGAAENIYPWLEDTLTIGLWEGERNVESIAEAEYRLRNARFERSIKLNRDRIADDTLTGFFSQVMPMMGRAAAKFHDQQLAQVILSPASFVAFNGSPFFSTTHPARHGAPTYSNSFALALNGDNFNTVRSAMRSRIGEGGRIRDIGDEFVLVVAPENERNARTIVEAESAAVVAGSGAAAIQNVQRGFARVVVAPELAANANRWALFATGLPIRPLIAQVREDWNFQALDADDSPRVVSHNENIYGVTGRFGYGVSFPWLAAVSDPDGAP